MKKIVRAIIIAEIEVDSEHYVDQTDEGIEKAELENWQEWIQENTISEEIIVMNMYGDKNENWN